MLSNREGLIFGLGNPLLDISADVDDDFLQKWSLGKTLHYFGIVVLVLQTVITIVIA